MRRALFILCLFCASAVISPVALRAATDTDKRAGIMVVKTVNSLPPAVSKKQTPPRATLTPLPNQDPHPFVTEFFGPPAATAKKKPTSATPVKTPTRLSRVD